MPEPTPQLVPPSDRQFWLERRRVLLQELALIERTLGMERTYQPKAEREQAGYEARAQARALDNTTRDRLD
jgi:hypothetical protein